MLNFKIFVLWLHVIAIVAWVGGLFAVSMVFVPVLSGTKSAQESARLTAEVVRRFLRISREIIFLIIITGILNLTLAGIARGFNFSPAYMHMLATKVVLFLAIVAIQIWQGMRLAPAITAAAAEQEAPDDGPSALRHVQRRLSATSLVSLLLAVAVILLGLGLHYR